MKEKVKGPSLNIWRALTSFRTPAKKSNTVIQIRKSELLFLIDEEDKFYVFKNEAGKELVLHKNAVKKKMIEKCF